MFRRSRILLVGVCATAVAMLGVAPAVAQSSSETPKATEIGVTAKEIRIAVIADVDNPFAPGLFKGAADGVKAAARYLNSKAGGGGVAGRRLVVDFIDSKLTPNDARNGRAHSGLRTRRRHPPTGCANPPPTDPAAQAPDHVSVFSPAT